MGVPDPRRGGSHSSPWVPDGCPTGGLLYPFGPGAGDEATPHEDDGMSPEIFLWKTFSFYGQPHHSLYVGPGPHGVEGQRGAVVRVLRVLWVVDTMVGVTMSWVNNNGVVSFGTGVPEFTPQPFPLPGHRPFVAPYWADVDTRLGGDVFYRQSQDPELLARLARDLAPAVTPPDPAPVPTWAFVATWHRVSFFGAASKKVNTFQAVLATDGVTSFVMLNYGDIQWTTGISNQGDPRTGMGGIPAQAGFNSGDDVHYYNIPGSRTPAVLSVGRRSNVGVPGRWIFRVDKFTATEGPPIFMETPSTPSPPPSTPSPAPTPRRTTKERVYICK
ncbi:hypothetical protein QYF61_006875, partial [Mycteria americana]